MSLYDIKILIFYHIYNLPISLTMKYLKNCFSVNVDRLFFILKLIILVKLVYCCTRRESRKRKENILSETSLGETCGRRKERKRVLHIDICFREGAMEVLQDHISHWWSDIIWTEDHESSFGNLMRWQSDLAMVEDKVMAVLAWHHPPRESMETCPIAWY